MNNSIRLLRALLTKPQKISFTCIMLISCGTAFLEVACAIMALKLSECAIDPSVGISFFNKIGLYNYSHKHIIIYMGALLCLIYVVKNIYATCEVYLQNKATNNANKFFQARMLYMYSAANYESFIAKNSAYRISVVAGDSDMIFSRGVLSLVGIVSELMILVSLMATVIYLDFQFFMCVAILMLFLWLLSKKIFSPYFYKLGSRNQAASMEKNKNITIFFHGFKEILLSNNVKYFSNLYLQHLDRSLKYNMQFNVVGSMPRSIIETCFLLVLIYGLYNVGSSGNVELFGRMGVYAYVIFRIMPSINKINNLLSNYSSAVPSIERFYHELNSLEESRSYYDNKNFEFKSSICLDNVSFKFKKAENQVINGMNLTINKGEFIAIVGPSGVGKSTILNMILGLLTPSSGKILIDKLYPANTLQWRQKIGYVPQSIYLFDASIADNIAFGKSADNIDHEKLQKAIEAAELKEFISTLKDGVNTLVGDRGTLLSGGECQRISIARALYNEPQVLILDEATSSLDENTESKIIDTIFKLKDKYTIIMVTHRIQAAKYCSRLIEINKDGIAVTDRASITA